MSRREEYARTLRTLEDPEPYLRQHSGLPGPRGNIELGLAAADACPPERLRAWAESDDEYLAFCGVLGERDVAELRRHASDPRWRVREAVAMALQRWGDEDFDALASAMAEWARGGWLERRAAAAALCEPRLLSDRDRVRRTLAVLEAATEPGDGSEAYRALRKGLGYCWSVAVAADPSVGRPAFEAALMGSGDRDLRWIARSNLAKRRVASEWAEGLLGLL